MTVRRYINWVIITLHASCGAVYCNWSCLWICDSGRASWWCSILTTASARTVFASLWALFSLLLLLYVNFIGYRYVNTEVEVDERPSVTMCVDAVAVSESSDNARLCHRRSDVVLQGSRRTSCTATEPCWWLPAQHNHCRCLHLNQSILNSAYLITLVFLLRMMSALYVSLMSDVGAWDHISYSRKKTFLSVYLMWFLELKKYQIQDKSWKYSTKSRTGTCNIALSARILDIW